MIIALNRLARTDANYDVARSIIERNHYLHTMPDPRTSYEVYAAETDRDPGAGYLVFGRPQATRCADWYGSVSDVGTGRCQVTRWQVLCLSRVWIDPAYQPGGCCYGPRYIPGFTDRKDSFRSTLASAILQKAVNHIGHDYLIHRPPVYLDEPYEIRWLMSYCDTRIHRGVIYQASGWQLYRTNSTGIQTWRIPLPAMTPEQDASVRLASMSSARANAYRAARAQLQMF